MARKAFGYLTTVSLVLCTLFFLLWLRAGRKTTDAAMLALPGGKCLLVTSHEGRWLAVSGVNDWPDRGIGVWSGASSWKRAGPFLFWQRHGYAGWSSVMLVHGSIAVPTDDGGKMPAYGDGYARADACNAWAGVLPNQPGWLFVTGWELRLPHVYLIAIFGALPLLVGPVWLMRVARRRLRKAEGLCVGCGYDIRATPDRCPECGRPTDRHAASATAPVPVTAPAGTAPAATAP